MKNDALVILAWSRVFSPLVDSALRKEAWHELGLSEDFEAWQPAWVRTFHLGLPQPEVPLLLHVLLEVDGGGLREELVRVVEYMELDWGEFRLPPDHLACILEIFGLALVEEEAVLVQELLRRHLLPWCTRAVAAVNGEDMQEVLTRFRTDLDAIAAVS